MLSSDRLEDPMNPTHATPTVNAEALRLARQGTPRGEYHHGLRWICLPPRQPGRCWKCHGLHATETCPLYDELSL
jgi:hypothetical protein